MTTSVYTSAKTAFLNGSLDLTSSLTVAAMNGSFVANDANTTWSDISANVIGTPVTAKTATVSSGKLNATFPDFTDVPSGAVISALVLFNSKTGALVSYDTSALNLPFTADGGNVSVSWTNGLVLEID